MSIVTCKKCCRQIDTDYNAEDINEDEICIYCEEESKEQTISERFETFCREELHLESLNLKRIGEIAGIAELEKVVKVAAELSYKEGYLQGLNYLKK